MAALLARLPVEGVQVRVAPNARVTADPDRVARAHGGALLLPQTSTRFAVELRLGPVEPHAVPSVPAAS